MTETKIDLNKEGLEGVRTEHNIWLGSDKKYKQDLHEVYGPILARSLYPAKKTGVIRFLDEVVSIMSDVIKESEE